MQTVTSQKLVNVFGETQLAKMESQASKRGKWITRHCNNLYGVIYDPELKSFSYFVERKSNRLHKFHDWSMRDK